MLSAEDRDDLILAFFEPGDDCAHNMVRTYALVDRIIARHVAVALSEAADAIEVERDRKWSLAEVMESSVAGGLTSAASIVRARIPKSSASPVAP